MVSDTPTWVPEAVQTVLKSIGVCAEVLVTMTCEERVILWKRFSVSDEVAALAEEAVCDAPDEVKSPAACALQRAAVEKALKDEVPNDYKPAVTEVSVTDAPSVSYKGLIKDDDNALAVPKKSLPAIKSIEYKYSPPVRSDLEESYVGILNQGGTCYLNSTVQVLFHIPAFRILIYGIIASESIGTDSVNITVALQNLFLSLQTKQRSISTVELTKSFGWNVSDGYEQHDAHEMIQRLLEAFEMITKDTPAKDELHRLFYGKNLNYVRCLDTGYVSRNPAEFFDLELLTLNMSSLEASLDARVKPEKLDDEYKREYEDGRPPTKHPAEMGSIFLSLPPVLFVHPSRVDFCLQTLQRKMVDTEWTFQKKINFSRYVAKDPESGVEPINDGTGTDDPELDYELLSVIMHQGTPFSGHYIAYVRFGEKWLKFNDSTVTEVQETTVLADAYSTPTSSVDSWGYKTTRPAYTRASVLVFVRSSMRDKLVFPIGENSLPSALHDNLKLKAQREEIARKEAEEKARRVSIRFIVADEKGNYLGKLGALQGKELPPDSVEMDKDTTGDELGNRLAEAAGISADSISELWHYPDYYWPNSSYSRVLPLRSDAKASDCVKGWLLIQLKGSLAQVIDADDEPMKKENTEVGMGSDISTSNDYSIDLLSSDPPKTSVSTIKSDPPLSSDHVLIPLCVLKNNTLEYVGICESLSHVGRFLDSKQSELLTESDIALATEEKKKRLKPISVKPYVPQNDDLYSVEDNVKIGDPPAEAEEPVILTTEDKYKFCAVANNELRNVSLRKSVSGSILIAYPFPLSTSVASVAYDRLCNPLNVTIYQLDDALTPEELCELVVCPSHTYEQLQDAVFEAMQGLSVELLAPIRRMPFSRDQIGFRSHDVKTDRPSKIMHLSCKSYYSSEKHTVQSILSNKSNYMITKVYIEVLPEVISIPELDGHGKVCDIPLHLGYFYQRHFYMKEGRGILLYEVFRIAMAQQLSSLPAEFSERVVDRWLKSRDAYLANKEAVASDPQEDIICKKGTFDPVFRLVRMAYNGTAVHSEYYDWSQTVDLDSYYEYVVDLLPSNITKVNWVRYVRIEPQYKPSLIASLPVDAKGDAHLSVATAPETEDKFETIPKVEASSRAEDSNDANDSNVAETNPTQPLDGQIDTQPVNVQTSPSSNDNIVVEKTDAAESDSKLEEATQKIEGTNVEDKTKPALMTESKSETVTGDTSDSWMEREESIIGEKSLMWYVLYHGDRRYTDAIYGLVSTVVLPTDESLTGADLMEIILRQIGIHPEDDRFPDSVPENDSLSPSGRPSDSLPISPSASAITSPATKVSDVYLTAKKTWKLVFKGKSTKVLEPNVPYSKISSDVGSVEYIMLDHPQPTKARVLTRHQRTETAIRIGIISSETEKMKKKHEVESSGNQ